MRQVPALIQKPLKFILKHRPPTYNGDVKIDNPDYANAKHAATAGNGAEVQRIARMIYAINVSGVKH